MHLLPFLRNARHVTRFVLVWFALSLGVAIASPLVKPQGMQLICSAAGTLKIVATTGDAATPDGPATTLAGHTLDCPLCANVGAPPPLAPAAFSATTPQAYALPVPQTVHPVAHDGAPLPARGPPAQA